MKRLDIIARIRANTRDFSNSIFRIQDIIDYINEGINRFKQVIPELSGMVDLLSDSQEPVLLPQAYHHLIAIYASAKCFAQDERFYQATTLMNEFEVKLQELQGKIESGLIVILDPVTGLAVATDNPVDYVDLKAYYDDADGDIDLGVLGVVY